ncbi:hypothetical protein BDN70DRAFT_888414 [Pholiota conissans]|uniref:Oxidoreductase AflY n=1 Tax=Pholiota conissans TaxID=109636 RepID=A0A9P5YP76_9AGAR|nr:hypothetical protein BDN70DRAFT_888414 [Pholiota conissans]
MFQVSYTLGRKGQLNTPGVTYASKKASEELLLKDAKEHHCFFNTSGFHNHLSHHILAAYDLGAPAGQLKAIYADVAKIQRPFFVEEQHKTIKVDKDNWIQYLGNESAYGSFVAFFSDAVIELGVAGTLEKYLVGPEANVDGVDMLNRVMTALFHSMIAIGYGVEFGNDTLVATGLAQAACHKAMYNFRVDKSLPKENVTLFGLLEQMYASKVLEPGPYDPSATFIECMQNCLANGGAKEIEKLCANWHISDTITDAEIALKSDEIIWAATLLTFATGKRDHKPRLSFFFMHILTSSLFIRPLCAVIKRQEDKAALLRAYVADMVLTVLMRGRAKIDADLIMSYNPVPRPPLSNPYPQPSTKALGGPNNDEEYNPWPALIEGVRYNSDSHVLKTMRSLVFAAQHLGDTQPGGVIGAFRSGSDGAKTETLAGIGKIDGTIFVRSAGVLMQTLGWSGYGQTEVFWDFGGIGWDEAWQSAQ